MVAAVDAVRERSRRITSALEREGIQYAVIGGNAIAAWVARVDLEAVRNTKRVEDRAGSFTTFSAGGRIGPAFTRTRSVRSSGRPRRGVNRRLIETDIARGLDFGLAP